jgi:hypothetical protein
MAYEITLINKKEIPFKYRNAGVGGKPIISLGDYEMPEAEWIGLLIHYFRQRFPQDDLRSKWVNNLDEIELLPIGSESEGWEWSFSFAKVMEIAQMEGSVSRLPPNESSFLRMSPPVQNGGGEFSYAGYKISGDELVKATNYLMNNYYFQSPHDYRLLLLEALIPNCVNF